MNPATVHNECGFYKIALVASHVTVHCADWGIEVTRPNLLFANSHAPCATDLHLACHCGLCVFV